MLCLSFCTIVFSLLSSCLINLSKHLLPCKIRIRLRNNAILFCNTISLLFMKCHSCSAKVHLFLFCTFGLLFVLLFAFWFYFAMSRFRYLSSHCIFGSLRRFCFRDLHVSRERLVSRVVPKSYRTEGELRSTRNKNRSPAYGNCRH